MTTAYFTPEEWAMLMNLPSDDPFALDDSKPPSEAEPEVSRKLTLPLSPEDEEKRLRPIRLEAARQKARLSSIPFHKERVAKEGDAYWMRLAQSYQGED